MARTPSSMLPLGTKAPAFALLDVLTDKPVSLPQAGKYQSTVIMFICNHCPYVKHVNAQLVQLARDYMHQNIYFIAINSNDIDSYPDDAPDKMKENAQLLGYPFPYLFDETQEVAAAYQAKCTPDFYVFDEELSLVYRGQLDDSRPGNAIPVTGKSIREALDHILANQPVPSENQKPSLGCNIKWKPDGEGL